MVTGLWNSYEDDAFATDKSAERFLDPAELHRLEHVGKILLGDRTFEHPSVRFSGNRS